MGEGGYQGASPHTRVNLRGVFSATEPRPSKDARTIMRIVVLMKILPKHDRTGGLYEEQLTIDAPMTYGRQPSY